MRVNQNDSESIMYALYQWNRSTRAMKAVFQTFCLHPRAQRASLPFSDECIRSPSNAVQNISACHRQRTVHDPKQEVAAYSFRRFIVEPAPVGSRRPDFLFRS